MCGIFPTNASEYANLAMHRDVEIIKGQLINGINHLVFNKGFTREKAVLTVRSNMSYCSGYATNINKHLNSILNNLS